MKIFTFTYVGLYDDDSWQVITRVATSYKEACEVRKDMLMDFGQPVGDQEGDEEDWDYELEEGDVIKEETHDFPHLVRLSNASELIRKALTQSKGD